MSIYYNVEDVMGLLECSSRTAYKVIKELRLALEEQGKITKAGKIQKSYFHQCYDLPEVPIQPVKPPKKKGKVENETNKKSLQKTG